MATPKKLVMTLPLLELTRSDSMPDQRAFWIKDAGLHSDLRATKNEHRERHCCIEIVDTLSRSSRNHAFTPKLMLRPSSVV